jgi:hypothetical protein
MAKSEHEHEHSHTAAEPAPAPETSPHMTRGQAMQSLHGLVNSYAEMWDEGRTDTPEPTTQKTWLADFDKFLAKH